MKAIFNKISRLVVGKTSRKDLYDNKMGVFCKCSNLMQSINSNSGNIWTFVAKNFLLIIVYYAFSIGLTFYQNHILKEIKFPLSIVLCHLVIKFLLASIIRISYEIITKKQRVFLDCNTMLKRLSLVGISGGLDIAFSNWGTMMISVSLYTMTKSTAIVFILFFALLFKLEEKHWSLFIIVGMISSGLFMFTYKSTQFHLQGFLLILSASFTSGLRWSMAQLIAQKSKLGLHNPIDMIYHFQPWMIGAVLPFALYFEGLTLSSYKISLSTEEEKAFFVHAINVILFGAFLAFFMEIAEYLLVIYTSSLTLSVTGVFKEMVTLCLAVIIDNDPVSTVNAFGLVLCFTGIICHVIFKFTKITEALVQNNELPGANNNGSSNNKQTVDIPLKKTNIFLNEDGEPLLPNSESSKLINSNSDSEQEEWSK